MKKLNPLKIHYFSYRLIFVVYWLLILSLYSLFRFIIFKDSDATLMIITLFSFLFSLIVGGYEYAIISNSYLSLKTDRKNFFVNSLIFSVISSLIILFSIIIVVIISNYFYEENVMQFSSIKTYIPLVFVFITLHFLGNFYSLVLRKIKFIKSLVFLVVITALIFKGEFIYNTLINSVLTILNSSNVSLTTFVSVLIIIVVNSINYYAFAVKY
ncbi:MAG: hypothetical protein WC008_01345 [Bacilli bacterium]